MAYPYKVKRGVIFGRGEMQRRSFLKAGATLAGALSVAGPGPTRADVPDHNWDGYDFGSGPPGAKSAQSGAVWN